MKRIPELDGLRGIAIGLVLVDHFLVDRFPVAPDSLWEYLQSAGRLTWSGVDLFFVLSGFLIGGILLDKRDSANYFKVFYVRRFFRIFPIYAAVMLAAYAAVAHGLVAKGEALGVGPWYAYALLIQNFWMAKNNDFGGFLAVTWSLAVEEQFYLTMPAIIRCVRQYRWVVVAGIVAAPILRTLIFYTLPQYRLGTYVLMPCRADALLLGVAGAVIARSPHREILQRNSTTLWTALCVLLIGAAVLTAHPKWIQSGSPGIQLVSIGYTWLALMYLCVLLLAVTQPQSWLGAILRFTPLRWLGTIAYSVYLLHLLVWNAAHHRAAGLVGTLTIAAISWHFFEKPIVKFGHRFHYQRRNINQSRSLPPAH